MARSKVKLSLIADKTTRRATFKKRKGGMMKKLNELTTLCGVKACAVVYSGPNDSNPEAWPSREGAEQVLSDFMAVPEMERGKKMYDQQSFILERIRKEEAKLKKLHDQNRELELREFMFDLVKGKMLMEPHYYDENVIRDLSLYVDHYLNQLTHRLHILQANGESSSASFPPPPHHVAVADAAPPVAVSDVPAVTTPNGFYDLVHQYQNMNVNQQAPAASSNHVQYPNMNQQELAQYDQVPPANVSDHVQYQNVAHQEQRQYQPLANVYDQNQHRFYGWNQDMSLDSNHNLAQSSNQYPNQHQPFMNQWMAPQAQQMSELASVASMDDNYYRYQQLPTASHMPSSTTVDLSAPNTNNNVWPTRIGLN